MSDSSSLVVDRDVGPDPARSFEERSRPARQLLAGSATVSIFNGLGVVVGFLLDAIVAALFGVGALTDAFFSAWRVPYLLSTVLIMAAAATLVPVFARTVDSDGTESLSDVFSRVFNGVTLVMAALCVSGILLAPWLVRGLFAGLAPESLALATSLSRILFLTLLVTGPVEVLRSLLYAHEIFGLPTAINVVRSSVTMVLLLATWPLWSRGSGADWWGLHVLAWGFVAGVVAQLAVLSVQALRRTKIRWQPLFDLRHPQLRRVARLSSAPTLGALVRQTIPLAETAIASYLPPGSVTILSYASRIMFVLSSVFLSSITTASMPMLSQAIAGQRPTEVRRTLVSAFRLVTFLAVPLGLGLALLGVPVIRLLLERGRFTAEASQLTGAILGLYAISILGLGYFRVVQAYFYAALKAWVVLVLFTVMAGSAIVLDIALAGLMGVRGIAIGFSVGTALTMMVGLIWLMREDTGLDRAAWRSLLSLAVKVGLATLVMAASTLALLAFLPDHPWALVPALVIGGAAFLLTARLLRIREVALLQEIIRRWLPGSDNATPAH